MTVKGHQSGAPPAPPGVPYEVYSPYCKLHVTSYAVTQVVQEVFSLWESDRPVCPGAWTVHNGFFSSFRAPFARGELLQKKNLTRPFRQHRALGCHATRSVTQRDEKAVGGVKNGKIECDAAYERTL
ncbi:hypothetical protein EVAR_76173_1 [Eumeta japonica]|uniref:Uncharacterized protein n=1 Tax=Eumeta variegata TaxID=151549 RepID=A0A4C1UWH4_EUMVA|nr:hypothetical protein EVAR_76173_1 [Eumeta japonica]